MQIFIAIVGYSAGVLAIISFIPQTIKTYKTQDTKDLSLKTYIIYNIANILFLLMGIFSIAIPIMYPENSTATSIIIWGLTVIFPYAVTISAVSYIIYVKIKNIKSGKESTKKENKNV